MIEIHVYMVGLKAAQTAFERLHDLVPIGVRPAETLEVRKTLSRFPCSTFAEHDLRIATPVRIGDIEVVYPKVRGVPLHVFLTRREPVRSERDVGNSHPGASERGVALDSAPRWNRGVRSTSQRGSPTPRPANVPLLINSRRPISCGECFMLIALFGLRRSARALLRSFEGELDCCGVIRY